MIPMDPGLHAHVWATVCAGVSANTHKYLTEQQIAERTDKIVALYIARHEQLFSDPRRFSSCLGDGK